ncbi:TonB-dependent receptor [Endothiovibrio diazotrophicus]
MTSRPCPPRRGLSALAAALLLLAPPAHAETDADAIDLGTLTVSGIRPSLASAQRRKREAAGVVDAIVAEEIGKLPDRSIGEALSRVTGVQIARDRGEGGTVAVRGLTQLEATLNGREIFTAGWGRNLDFNDLPAELVAGIDVHKSVSAERIEGGIGGTIDLRTYRPFDFAGRRLAVTAGAIHGDLADETRGRLSLLASDRWRTRAGEVGALLSLSTQQRPWREDQKSTGAPTPRDDLIAGRTLLVPNGSSETTSRGLRERNALDLVLQWRPNDALELYAEATGGELRTDQDSYQLNASTSSTFLIDSLARFPASDDLQRITWSDAPISILSFARDTVDRTGQLAAGGRWVGDALTLSADLSRTESRNELLFAGPFLAADAARFSQDLAGDLPATAVSGTDLLDPANLRYTGIAYRYRPFRGDLTAARLDGEYFLDLGPLESIEAGLRLARRGADNAPGLIFADASVSGIGAADRPGYLIANPYPTLLPGEGASSIGHYRVGDPTLPWASEALRQQFGITTPIAASGDPLGVWRVHEETRAGYLKANFAGRVLPVDGNLGVRVVTTREALSGHQSRPGDGSVEPIAIDHRYTDTLPSLNLRYRLGGGWQLRAALARSITRPDFNQLSPSLSLLQNSLDPTLNQGSAGNPELQPVRADNLDLAIERYLGPTTALHATLFAKRVDGFVVNESNPELHDGALYQVSRPYNANHAEIRGLELGWQHFFDRLPGGLRGFGVQANYTYIDSTTFDATLGTDVPLQNLSRHSANLVGLYERGPLSARLAYNWRDDFLSGVTNLVGVGALPIYTEGYGWLDGSLSWRARDDLTLTLAAGNLLGTVRRAYYGTRNHPQSSWLNDTRLSLSVTARF